MLNNDTEQSLRDAFYSANIAPPDHFDGGGQLIRYTMPGDRPQKKNGWYILHDDSDLSCCIFGCWTSPYQSHKWLSRDLATFTEADKKAWKQKQDSARKKRDAEREKLYSEQRPVFEQIMAKSFTEGIEEFPYVVNKKILPTGAALSEYMGTVSLVIPRYKSDVLVGIQKIEANGSKKYMYGTESKGSYTMLNGSSSRAAILLCEGWATGCTLHEALGCHVAVAFDAGNLLPVAKALVNDYPYSPIIICADDDHEKEVNTGLTKATEAGKAIGCPVITPEFHDPSGLTDFNDMAHEQGVAAVRDYVTGLVTIDPKPPLFADGNSLLDAPIVVRYLVAKVIERDCLVEIFGPPGSGKSFVSLDIGLSVATGQPWGEYATHAGMVVYFAGEGFGGLSRRVKAWHFAHGGDLANFYLSRSTISFSTTGLHEAEAEINILEAERSTSVALIIIDTLARHMVGDENSTSDMGEFIRNLDLFRQSFPDAVVLVVHHTGHGDGNRGRGSSALKGAVESEIQCNEGVLTWTKMKDGETPVPLPFKLNSVVLGADEDGNPVTSCYPIYGEGDEKFMSQSSANALLLLRDVLAQHGERDEDGRIFTTIDMWRMSFMAEYKESNPKTTGNAARQAWHKEKAKVEPYILSDGNFVCIKV